MPFSIQQREGSEKMFSVEGTNISISRGDTGAVRFHASVTRRDTGTSYTFGEKDRAVFSIKDNTGALKRQKSYPMTNNAFIVVFTNQDTENLSAGSYSWDVRYVINPYYDTDPPAGTWTDYDDLTFPVAKDTKCMHGGTYYIAKQTISTSEDWTPAHWMCADFRHPVDGDQVITPNLPMNMNMLTVVGEI